MTRTIHVIEWDKMEPREWGKVLSSIPVGDYVSSLPYDSLSHASSIVIPVEVPAEAGKPVVLNRMVRYGKIYSQDNDSLIWKRIE